MIESIISSLGENAQPRMIELGKIKIGGLGDARQKQGGGTFRLPQKHDHFTITTLNRSTDGAGRGDLLPDDRLMKKLVEKYGDPDGKLRQLPIRVMSNDIDDVIQAAWVWYGGKTCGARSDGKTVTWFVNPENNRPYDPPVEQDWKPGDEEGWTDQRGNKLFKLHSVFNCVIAAEDARWGGVYKFRTTSIVSFKQLYASLIHIHQLTGGILIGMPLMLVVRPIQVAPEGKPTTVYVVHCELRGSEMRQIQQQAMQQQAWMIENKQKMLTMQTQYRRLLVPPGQENTGDVTEISTEFQPESQEIEAAPSEYSIIDAPDQPVPEAADPSPDGLLSATEATQRETMESGGRKDESFAETKIREESPDEEIALDEAYSQGADDCRRTLHDHAKRINTALKRQEFEGALFKYAHSRGVTVQKINKPQWIEIHKAIADGSFDFRTGKILAAAG